MSEYNFQQRPLRCNKEQDLNSSYTKSINKLGKNGSSLILVASFPLEIPTSFIFNASKQMNISLYGSTMM